MNQNFFLFLCLSFFIHTLLIVSFLFSPTPASLKKAVPIQLTTNIAPKNKQAVEQFFFNDKLPSKTQYLSQHNNTTLEEQKGHLGRGRNSLSQIQPFQDNSLGTLKLQGFKGSIDFLNIQKEGKLTLLNTQGMWFYGFYSRIKNQIYWHWINNLQQELLGANLESLFRSKHSHIAHIEAFLDTEGNLLSVIVKNSSGLEELNTASIMAFQKAHPFPNPPSPLIQDKKVRLEYTFVLSLDTNKPTAVSSRKRTL